MASTAGRPLEGVRVLDFSRVLSGPIAGRVLHDLGAEVVKVEPPDGDLTRFALPKAGITSAYFAQQNTGKRNISLDLHRGEAVELLLQLATHFDVVIENSRPGVMDRLGLGYEALHARNPKIVYASITGYGQTGVWADRRAFAVVVHAEMGLLEAGGRWRADAAGSHDSHEGEGHADAEARLSIEERRLAELDKERFHRAQDPMSHADVYAGLHCSSAILAALIQRGRTGTGQHIDVDMAESLLHVNDFAHWDLAGASDDPEMTRPSLAPVYSPIVTTKDGQDLVLAGDPVANVNFGLYCKAMERTDLGELEIFSTENRARHRHVMLDLLHDWAATFDRVEDLQARLDAAGIVNGVVRSIGDVADTQWARERGAIAEVDDRRGGTVRIPQAPWRFSDAETGVRGVPAWRGEHNREVLQEFLGLNDDAINRLKADGTLSERAPNP
ncbi:putative acyl-CoA transferase/carnitine dehydratase [Actinobacteria bacterium IMCC26256]|nr:putative acyl-CoA transferase/carnitine dehydratase [Actinobacteria bacterium IMCC26256]